MMAQEACAKVLAWPFPLAGVVSIYQACNGTLIGYNDFRQLCHVCLLP
jgi:hypothetical protein